MKKITTILLLAFLSLNVFAFQANAAEEDNNVDEVIELTIQPDTELNPEGEYEDVEGYSFQKDGVVGLKVEPADDEIKGALGIEGSGTYLMVTVATRALSEEQTIDSIDARVNVNPNVYTVEAMTEGEEGNDGKIIAGEAFPNVEESFYDEEEKQLIFKASNDTPISLGVVTDVFSYLLKVKEDNTLEEDVISLEGVQGDNQGLIIISSTGDDVGANLFKGLLGMKISGLPTVAEPEVIEAEPEVIVEAEPEVKVEPVVEPEKIETGAKENILFFMLFLLVALGSIVVTNKKQS